MRIFAVSDLHTDYQKNMDWLRQLVGGGAGAGGGGGGEYAADTLLVAGDVSDSLDTLRETLLLLAGAFAHVFFTVGNHDLWVRRQERELYDSLGKLRRIQELCEQLEVHTAPACVEGVWVVPLLSWYHATWDREPDVPGSTPIQKVMLDFHVCSWGSQPQLSNQDDSLARHFDELNEQAGFSATLQRIEEATAAAGGVRPPVISFSHFLPRQDLLPEKRMLYYPELAKAAGSDWLERRIRRLRPAAHVFGHTHFSWDAEVDGIRYVQWPLGYPHEQSQRRAGGAGWLPMALYTTGQGSGGDGSQGGLSERRSCYWSDLYESRQRDPYNTNKAPWVAG